MSAVGRAGRPRLLFGSPSCWLSGVLGAALLLVALLLLVVAVGAFRRWTDLTEVLEDLEVALEEVSPLLPASRLALGGRIQEGKK